MYLNSFDYFRAITIILIVMGHCYAIAGWQIETFFDRTFANMVSGGTSLFVFISGFLFYHVFYHRFEYKSFIKKKIKNVYSPYIFLSILPICYALYVKMPYKEYFFGPTDTFYDQLVRPAFLYFWHGGVMVYWYIPFIMTIFLISPLFIFFIRLDTQKQIRIVAILSIISAFVHRPVHNISIIQSVIYFTPVYMFGILCSMQKEYIYEKLKGKEYIICGVIVLLAMLQACTTNVCGNIQKNIFEFNGVDIAYFQKLCMCLVFMVFLHRFEDKNIKFLKQIAASSFSIYFLHGWFIFFISKLRNYYADFWGLHLLPLMSFVVIACSYALALGVKKAFPQKSRMLVGW